MADIPNHLEAHKHRKHKHDKMLHETGRCIGADKQHQCATNSQQSDLVFRLLLKGSRFFGAAFFGCFFRNRFFWLRRDRLHFWRWRREGYRALMRNRGTTDHIIFHIMMDLSVFLRRQIGHHMADIRCVKR